MPTADQVIERARQDLGYVEDPAGSNRTKFGEWYGLNPAAWCAMALSKWFFDTGLPLVASTSKGFAYTPSGANWFRKTNRWKDSGPQRGDVVFFDFPGDGVDRISHVGLVESVNPDGSINTIEANTDERGGRTGGKVMTRIRRFGIVGYGAPAYDAASAPPPPPPPQPETEKDRIKQLQERLGFRGRDVDGIFGRNTTARAAANMVGWPPYVRQKGYRGALRGNANRDLVLWLRRQCNRKYGMNMAVHGGTGPDLNHGIVVGLGQRDGIAGPNGFREACR